MLRRLFPSGRRELSLVLLDEAPMRELNARYRGVEDTTDVLAFSQLEGEEGQEEKETEGRLLGDVVICVPVASGQAAERGETLQEELELLVAHGILHLAGYDDEDPQGAARMRAAENELLGRSIMS